MESNEGPNQYSRILVVRPDRLGDVLLSTPVFEGIKTRFPNSELTVLVKESVLPVLKDLPSVDHFIVYDPTGRHSGWKGFYKLYQEIRKFRFDLAIVLQSQWKIAFAIFLARIRHRVGPRSKIHSFLFYNLGMRQRRSNVEMHEADYNLQLLNKIGIFVESRKIPTQVSVSDLIKKSAFEFLIQSGWDGKKELVVVHPGMGGSALNWPEENFHILIRTLIEDGYSVLITAGPAEVALLGRIKNGLGNLASQAIFYSSSSLTSVDYFAGLLSFATVVVAPSTGPLHLAVALGKRVVTFFPPIQVQSTSRWGPYLPDESRASVLTPPVECGQDFQCLGQVCNYFPCMKILTVENAVSEVKKQIAGEKSAGKFKK